MIGADAAWAAEPASAGAVRDSPDRHFPQRSLRRGGLQRRRPARRDRRPNLYVAPDWKAVPIRKLDGSVDDQGKGY